MMSACCRRCKDIDYIIVPIGALEKIGGATHGIMAEPSFCPRFGDVSLESGNDNKLIKGFPPFPVLRKDYHDNMKISVVWPDYRVRTAYGQHLLAKAISYMILHEMGHVFCGHMDAAIRSGDEYADMSFASLPPTCRERIPQLIYEIDVDMFAIFNLPG